MGSAELSAEARSGSSAVRLRHDGELDWAFSNSTRHDVQSGQTFTASAWVKGRGGVELAVVALAQGKVVYWNIGSEALRAADQWKLLSAEALVPEGCDQIYVRFVGRGAGDLLLDDVALRPGGRPRVEKPRVHFPHEWDAPTRQVFAALHLDRSDRRATRAFSGIATYAKQFHLSAAQLPSDQRDTCD